MEAHNRLNMNMYEHQNYFGTYKLTEQPVLNLALETAWEAGYRMFDCAELYKNQHWIGQFFTSRKIQRAQYWLTSKVSFRTIPKGPEAIIKSIEKTLSDLQTEYLDLVLIHGPCKSDIAGWEILTEYKAKGIIKNIGISNYSVENLTKFIGSISNPSDIYCNQIEFNPWLNRKDLISMCKSHGIRLCSYGNLYRTNELTSKLAEKYRRTEQQILLKFAQHIGFDPITSSDNPAHIKSNAQLDFSLDLLDVELLDGLNENYSQYKRFL